MKVDLLFKNGKVLTLDHNNRRAGSVAVSQGKIVGIWETAEPPKDEVEITQQTNVVDLDGAALLPGFIDTHNHMLMYGQTRDMVNCSTPPNKSIKDILDTIGKKAKETQNGEWIQGFGYDDTLIYEKRHLTRVDLDQVTPNNPVFISHASGHLAYANTLAIQMAGLQDTISDPQGGHYGRDEKGRLNGVLYEPGAQQPISSLIPKPTVGELVRILEKISKDYVAQGITTNSDAAIIGLDDFEAHLQASKLRVNPMRMQLMMMHYLLSDGAPYGGYTSEQLDIEIQARSGGWAKLDSAKMFQDGSIQGLTGALREPYYQNPDVYGDFIHPQEFLNEEVLNLHRRGYRMTTHGNGDRAIGSILDAYEYALKQHPRTDHRHRIEHVQSATTEDIARMGELGVAGSFFINHVYYWGDRHERIFLGPKRGRRISPLAEAVEHNLLFALHSDCPITPISPLFSVWAAVNRITREGHVLGPEQRIDVVTALKSMTIYGAKFIFDEDHSGSIEMGKKADFVVLEEDPTMINPLDIKDVSIQSTYINGEPVYGQKTVKTT
ncbi:amidohydrolase [Bacillus sp. EB106-08-02-XG196]|uniref:amidohydrolase n=1 Tax=Bacillus sp. EB106-08-02-XG196 TaxID=2737049 RepID=UPI0015C4B961|nr:amidohydrolase [Bacillus sp. EB106-08-02-XG196]NWQ43389.1 amidohydrolase [Bacillus sp. EB106-08-02-XG196]